MTEHDLLKAARELIATPAQWTQGTSARDILGNVQDPYEDDNASYCLLGAFERAEWEAGYDFGGNSLVRARAIHAFSEAVAANMRLTVWNDHPGRTHAEVLAGLVAAIEATAT